jgi:hypothetical protein
MRPCHVSHIGVDPRAYPTAYASAHAAAPRRMGVVQSPGCTRKSYPPGSASSRSERCWHVDTAPGAALMYMSATWTMRMGVSTRPAGGERRGAVVDCARASRGRTEPSGLLRSERLAGHERGLVAEHARLLRPHPEGRKHISTCSSVQAAAQYRAPVSPVTSSRLKSRQQRVVEKAWVAPLAARACVSHASVGQRGQAAHTAACRRCPPDHR